MTSPTMPLFSRKIALSCDITHKILIALEIELLNLTKIIKCKHVFTVVHKEIRLNDYLQKHNISLKTLGKQSFCFNEGQYHGRLNL